MNYFDKYNYEDFLIFSKRSKNCPKLEFEDIVKIVKKSELDINDLLILFKNKIHLDQNLHLKYELEIKKIKKELEMYRWFVMLKSNQ
jgi:hypothetical protein